MLLTQVKQRVCCKYRTCFGWRCKRTKFRLQTKLTHLCSLSISLFALSASLPVYLSFSNLVLVREDRMTNEPTVECKIYDKRSNGVVYAVQCNNEIQERTNNKVLLLQEQRSAVLFSLFLFVCVRVCDERKNAPTKVLSLSLSRWSFVHILSIFLAHKLFWLCYFRSPASI